MGRDIASVLERAAMPERGGGRPACRAPKVFGVAARTLVRIFRCGGNTALQSAGQDARLYGRRDARRYSRSAFTLIELMVVLALIGIMTAMIIPEMRGTFQDAVLRSSSRELVNVFNLAYSRAVTVNQLQRVRIDPGTGRYIMERRVRAGVGESSFAPVQDVPGGEGTIDSRISMELRRPGEGLSDGSDQGEPMVSRDDATVRDQAIAFYPDGTADAGEVLLQDRDGFRLALRINPITARVNIVELERRGP